MEEIIEGCFKVFGAIVLFLCAPVIALIYAWYGLRWVWRHVAMWWVVNGTHVMVGVALVFAAVVLVFIVGTTARHWWELHQVNSPRRRALRQLGRLHQQAAVRIDQVGRQLRTSGGHVVVVRKK